MGIEFGDLLDPSERVFFVSLVETGYRSRHARAHARQASIRKNHSNFTTTRATLAVAPSPHSLVGWRGQVRPSAWKIEGNRNALRLA